MPPEPPPPVPSSSPPPHAAALSAAPANAKASPIPRATRSRPRIGTILANASQTRPPTLLHRAFHQTPQHTAAHPPPIKTTHPQGEPQPPKRPPIVQASWGGPRPGVGGTLPQKRPRSVRASVGGPRPGAGGTLRDRGGKAEALAPSPEIPSERQHGTDRGPPLSVTTPRPATTIHIARLP